MKNIIFLSLRGLGDSVILAGCLRKIGPDYSMLKVITWDAHEPVFTALSPQIEIIKLNQFHFFYRIYNFFYVLWVLRKSQAHSVVNLYGDFIQSFLTYFSNSKTKISPEWAPNHPYRKLLRYVPFHFNKSIYIDISIKNVYEIHRIILSTVFPDFKVRQALDPVNICLSSKNNKINIAVMVGAADISRQWPPDKWISLFRQLKLNQIEFTIYVDQKNIKNISVDYADFSSQIKYLAYPDLLQHLNKHSFGIGLDSFSSHIFEYQGIQSVLIYGSNLPDFFKPPNATALSSSGGCKCYPCYNRPSCISSASEFACIKSIEPEAVFLEVNKLL